MKSTGRQKCKYPFGEYHSRRREKINSKNSFSVGKQRQRRRRNAKGELKKQREGEAGSSDALLFPPHRVLRVLHCVGIHFNEFAFQERIILFGLVSHSCSLPYSSFFSLLLNFPAPYRRLTDLQITFIRLLVN